MEDVLRRKSLYGFEYREPDQRRRDDGRKTYDIKQVWQRTHEILKLLLLGYKAVEVASMLGVTPQTVSNTANSSLGMQRLSEMREERDRSAIDVAKEVERLYPEALKVYEDILASEADLKLKKDVADTILMDIGGHRAPTKVNTQAIHAHLTMQEIEDIKTRGRAAALASGHLVEIDDSAKRSERFSIQSNETNIIDAEIV